MRSDLPTDAIPHFTHRQIMRVLSGVLLCIFLAAIDQTVVIPAVPAIAADLNGFGHLAWIVSAYLLTSTAATPIYGRLSDMYGRRKLLMPALALFAVASVLCALSSTLPQLIAARALQGIGGAGLMAMAQASIADVVSPRERGRYQGYMASTWGICSIAGPIIGGWVTDNLSWRWIFWINVPIALIAILLCDRALRLLQPRASKARIDYLGAALLTGGITAWLLAMSWGGVELPWTSPVLLGLLAFGAVLIVWLAVHERRVAEPLLPPRLFANEVFLRGVGTAFFAALGLFGVSFLLPLYFQLIHGANAGQSGTLVVPFLGSNCVGAIVAGQIARRTGRTKHILLAGQAMTLVGFLLLATLGPASSTTLAVLYQFLPGIGLGLIMPSALVLVQNAAERRDVGVATGSLLLLRSMGGAFGSTLTGALLASSFASALAAQGITAHIDIGEMRGHGTGEAVLTEAVRQALGAGLASGFHLAFLACAVLTAVSLGLAFGMREQKLRSSTAPTVTEPAEREPASIGH